MKFPLQLLFRHPESPGLSPQKEHPTPTGGKHGLLARYLLSLILVLPFWAAAQPCGDLSPDGCATVVVPLDYQLIFNGCEGGIEDGAALGTGFTMVQPHSEARLLEDQFGSTAPFQTFPAVPGYEPSRLAVNNGALTITASRGIAYLAPPGEQQQQHPDQHPGRGLAKPSNPLRDQDPDKCLDYGGQCSSSRALVRTR